MLTECDELQPAVANTRSSWRLSRMASNTLYNIGTAGISAAGKSALFFIGPILLDPAVFGVYAYFFWVASVATSFGSAGTVLVAQRYTSRFSNTGRERKFTRFLLHTTFLLTCVALLVLLALPRSVTSSREILGATIAFAISFSIVAVQQAQSQAQDNFRSPFIGETVSQLIRFVWLAVLRFVQAMTPGSFLVLDTIVSVAKSAVLKIRSRAICRTAKQATIDWSTKVSLLRTCVAPVTAIAVLETILWQRGEIFFLGLYSGAAATAYFTSAAQVGQLFALAPTAALSSLMPRMAEKAVDGLKPLNEAINRLLNMALLGAVPLFCVGVLSGPLIVRFWKPQYAAVTHILPLIMIGRVALVLSAPISLALYASGRERMVLGISVTSALGALLVDSLLIPRYGLNGASCACAINQTLCAVITALVGARCFSYELKVERGTVGLLCLIGLAQFPAAFSAIRTHVAVIGILACIVVLLHEPFIANVVVPTFRESRLGGTRTAESN